MRAELEPARPARPQGGFARGPRPDELLLIGASSVAAHAVPSGRRRRRIRRRSSAAAAVYAIHASWRTARCRIGDDRSPCGSRQVAAEAGARSVVSVEALVPVGAAAPDAHDPPTTRSRPCRRASRQLVRSRAGPGRRARQLRSRAAVCAPGLRGAVPALVIATAPRPASLSARIRLAANKLQPAVTRDCAECAHRGVANAMRASAFTSSSPSR